jgi:hypothetical protein
MLKKNNQEITPQSPKPIRNEGLSVGYRLGFQSHLIGICLKI